jgi:hypothetical protein
LAGEIFMLEANAIGARRAWVFDFFGFVASAVDPRASDRPRRHCASRDERRGAPPRRGRGARGWRARARARAPVHADGLGQGTSRALRGDRASCRREPAHLSVRRLPFWHLPASLRIVFAVLAAEAPASASDARERPPPPDGRRADADRFAPPNLNTASPRGADHRRRPRPWSPRHSRLPLRLTTARKNRRRRRRSSPRSCGSRFPVNRTTS